ncbi:MAG: hypothetical protein GEU80_10265 [Dehalococcoidia bacterium]|nr:hypothetical protein [Dehalococcoidia bacterium]
MYDTRTAAELRQDLKHVRERAGSWDTGHEAGRNARARDRRESEELEDALEAAEKRERAADVAAEEHREQERARWEAERQSRRQRYIDVGGDASQFDKEWPALKSRLIEERENAARNHPRLARVRL